MTSDADDIDVRAFLGGKTQLARALAAGECGGKYEDAILIVSSIFSSFSALFWPKPGDDTQHNTEETNANDAIGGRQKSTSQSKWTAPDAKRFIEFWVTYADPALESTKISVTLLAHDILQRGDASSLDSLKTIRPRLLRYSPLEIDWAVATGDADAYEAEIVAACSGLRLAQIRKWSYPAVFYREVRSAYVHELNPGKHASPIPGGKSVLQSHTATLQTRRITASISRSIGCAGLRRVVRAVRMPTGKTVPSGAPSNGGSTAPNLPLKLTRGRSFPRR